MSAVVVEEIAQMLRDEGYRPTVDDGAVAFKVEGTLFAYETFGEDDAYARLKLGYGLPEDVDFARALRLANERNASAKAVKTTLYEHVGNAIFTVEQFFDEPARLQPTLERSIAGLRAAADEFFTGLTAPEDDASLDA